MLDKEPELLPCAADALYRKWQVQLLGATVMPRGLGLDASNTAATRPGWIKPVLSDRARPFRGVGCELVELASAL